MTFSRSTCFPSAPWFHPPSKIATKKQWSFVRMWKVYPVASKGPGRRSSCQWLVKTLRPPSWKENVITLAKTLHLCAGPWVISFVISKKTCKWWSLETEWLSWTVPLISRVNNRSHLQRQSTQTQQAPPLLSHVSPELFLNLIPPLPR